MLVLDLNILLPVLETGAASPILKALVAREPDWCMPDLWRYELAHVLRNRVRLREWGIDQALECARRAEVVMVGRERAVSPHEALLTALDLGLSGYDGAYVALARSLGCRLLTLDQEILRKAPGVAVGLV